MITRFVCQNGIPNSSPSRFLINLTFLDYALVKNLGVKKFVKFVPWSLLILKIWCVRCFYLHKCWYLSNV